MVRSNDDYCASHHTFRAMAGQEPNDPLEDLRLLGLPPGSDAAALKPAWRRAVSGRHPDRQGGVGHEEVAELNAAYRRLEAYVAAEGRLPAPALVRPTVRISARPTHRLGLRAIWGALLIATAIALAWCRAPAAPGSTTEEPPLLSSGPGEAVSPILLGASIERIKVGSSMDDVERLAGKPTFRTDALWRYGPSLVHFENGVVVDWHSSPLQPLPVTDSPLGRGP